MTAGESRGETLVLSFIFGAASYEACADLR